MSVKAPDSSPEQHRQWCQIKNRPSDENRERFGPERVAKLYPIDVFLFLRSNRKR